MEFRDLTIITIPIRVTHSQGKQDLFCLVKTDFLQDCFLDKTSKFEGIEI